MLVGNVVWIEHYILIDFTILWNAHIYVYIDRTKVFI